MYNRIDLVKDCFIMQLVISGSKSWEWRVKRRKVGGADTLHKKLAQISAKRGSSLLN